MSRLIYGRDSVAGSARASPRPPASESLVSKSSKRRDSPSVASERSDRRREPDQTERSFSMRGIAEESEASSRRSLRSSDDGEVEQ